MRRILTILSLLLISAVASHAQSVPAYVPTSGLVAYYGFDGNANDLSGNGNNGILEKAGSALPSLATDRHGNANRAYQFGGVDNPNWVRVPNSSTLRFTNGSTVSFWMMQSSARGGDYSQCGGAVINDGATFVPIAKGGNGDCSNIDAGIALTSRLTGNTQFFTFLNTNSTFLDNVALRTATYNCYSPNEWIHVVITSQDNQFRIYINGILYFDNDATQLSYSVANNKDFTFGCMSESNATVTCPFSGKLDDIAIYNRGLSAAEVNQLYNNYVDNASSEPAVAIDDVDVVNPCGNNNGTITFHPHAVAGVTYSYGLNSINDLQSGNSFSLGPGTYNLFVASSCRQWDTTITLVCDCATDPTHLTERTVCPGYTGQTGQQYEPVVSYSFNSNAEGWSADGYWAVGSGESRSCYNNLGASSAQVSSYSGKSFFCSNLTKTKTATSFPSNTSNLTSPAISITYDPTTTPLTLTFYARIQGFSSSLCGNFFNTLTLYIATSTSGPWTRIWSGGGAAGYGSWTKYTVSLSNYIQQAGTYYFRFVNVGAGYCTAVDNFAITADTRWNVPAEVTNAPGGTTVRTEKTISSAGTCPIADVTLWHISPLGDGHDTVRGCDSVSYGGRWYFNDDAIKKTGYKTTNDCDSVHTQHIVVYRSDTPNIIDESVCDSYVWPVDNKTYTFSVDTGLISLNQYGCKSIDSLYLTVNYSFDTSISDTVYQQDLPYIAFNGQPYDYEMRNELFHYTTVAGCDSNYHLTISITYRADDCDAFLQFPNIITPNGDGHNDRFVIAGLDRGCYPHNSLTVYNRWGAVVFRAVDMKSVDDMWNPVHKPSGTYFYYFEAHGASDRVDRRGVVEVIK